MSYRSSCSSGDPGTFSVWAVAPRGAARGADVAAADVDGARVPTAPE